MKFHTPLLLAFATIIASSAAHAATFNVITSADLGIGSPRQAVSNANFAATDDTITFGVNGPLRRGVRLRAAVRKV